MVAPRQVPFLLLRWPGGGAQKTEGIYFGTGLGSIRKVELIIRSSERTALSTGSRTFSVVECFKC
jgi:hypothetical protein